MRLLIGLFVVLAAPSLARAQAPTITGQPQSMTVTTGQRAYFIVYDISSCGLILPHWQFNGVYIEDGPTYTGTHTGVLYVNNATPTQAGSYRVVIPCANGTGTTISNAATLTVNSTGTPSGLAPIIALLAWSGCTSTGCTIWWRGINGAINAKKLTLTPYGGASIDVTGLTQYSVNPTSTTVYTLTASNAAGTFAQNVVVPVGPSTSVAHCREITSPGNYLVTTSIGTSSLTTPCLNVHDTHNVFIRSNPGVVISGTGGWYGSGTTGGAIRFSNVNDFALNGCTLLARQNGNYCTFVNASVGAVSGNIFGSPSTTFGQSMQLFTSNYITFAANTVFDAVTADHCTGLAFTGNTIANRASYETPGNVVVVSGSGNQILGNRIDGGRGIAVGGGVDDGIVPSDESGDLIAYNAIRNCRDAGIEQFGALQNTLMYENSVANSNFGISAWYGLSLRGCQIEGNRIISMPTGGPVHPVGFSFRYVSLPGRSSAYFENNTFRKNTVVNSAYANPSEFLNNGYVLPPSAWVIRNNRFSGNDFGSGVAAPIFFSNPYMPGVATDDGGNSCTHPVPYPPGYPLNCR